MLHLSIVPGADVTAVRMAGELDCAGVEAVSTLVGSLRPPRDAVVLDLSGLTFVDVAGSRALDDAVLALGCRGVRTRIEGASPALRRVRDLIEVVRAP